MPMPHDHDPVTGTDTEPTIAEPLTPPSVPVWTPDPVSPPAMSGTADAAAFSTRTGGPSKLRVGAVAGAAVALAVGAVATSLAATPPAPSSATTVSGTTTSAGVVGTGVPAPGVPRTGGGVDSGWIAANGPATLGDDQDAFAHGRFGGQGFHDITVSAISGTNVTLKTDDGWTRTIAVTDSMTITKGGQEIALSGLKVGDQVRIDQTRNADGTYTVNGLVVVVPTVAGTVSDVSSSGFKVTNRDGSVWTVTVNGSTTYKFGTGDGSLSDVKNGSNVLVQGQTTGDNAMTALTVTVPADRVAGTVKSTTSDTIVVTRRDGSTVTVHVSSDTTYRVAGVDTAKLSDITAGMAIGVSGRDRSDGSIDADLVVAGQGGFRGMDGDLDGGFGGMFGGRGGHGGFGPGMGGDDWGGTTPTTPTPSPTTSS